MCATQWDAIRRTWHHFYDICFGGAKPESNHEKTSDNQIGGHSTKCSVILKCQGHRNQGKTESAAWRDMT